MEAVGDHDCGGSGPAPALRTPLQPVLSSAGLGTRPVEPNRDKTCRESPKGDLLLTKPDPVAVLVARLPAAAWSDSLGPESWYAPGKAALDFLLALVLFVLALPVIVLAGLLVKLTSPGPVFYRQTRLGKGGRPFTLYKIRSMRLDSEKNGACWSVKGDPRITLIGRILRATHLDELPQLLNVLRGEMSLVGPRPERPEFIPTLAQSLPRYRERLRVRPGVTGLAQVWLPADIDLESVRQKLLYDLYYVENYGPWLDLRLILATALKMFGIPFPLLGTLFLLPRVDEASPAAAERSAASGQVFVEQLSLNPAEQAS